MSLTEEQKKLLQSTGNVLKDQGKEIMTKFYANLFKDHPEYHNFFNPTNLTTGKQPEAFAQTIYYFTQNLNNLDVMQPQMSRLSSKHRAVGVKPENYPTVGKYLVQAIQEVLGSKATPEVVAAYHALYSVMSSTFIKKEKELYEQLGGTDADKGFVPFKVVKKDTVASGPTYVLTLQREDGGKPWNYTPGQYITIQVDKNGVKNNGHYTLLEPPNGSTYSVGFKQGNPLDQNVVTTEELVNNRPVGSTVLVSGPAGSFGLVSGAKSNLFISGGIGITSLSPMINQLIQDGKAASATVIQCVRTAGHAAFGDKLSSALPKGQYIVLTEKEPISQNHLQGKVNADTQIYISGSEAFLGMVDKALAGLNVSKSQIHIKSIEPTLGLLKAIAAK
jgi:nitric oxide dioxygenase